MKFGPRKPNFKKSLKARTTGRAKRAVKKSVIPGYGKKGMGYVKNPKKAVYNKVYNKTTFRVFSSISGTKSSPAKSKKPTANQKESAVQEEVDYTFDADDHLVADGEFSIYELDVEKLNELKENRLQHKEYHKKRKKSLPIWRKIFYSDKPKLNKKEKEIYTQAMSYYAEEVHRTSDEVIKAEGLIDLFILYQECLEALYGFIKMYENSANVINYQGEKPFDLLENLVYQKDALFKDTIRKYFEKEKASALELKTVRGQKNRMIRKYEDLMTYDYALSSDQIKLIYRLWESYLD